MTVSLLKGRLRESTGIDGLYLTFDVLIDLHLEFAAGADGLTFQSEWPTLESPLFNHSLLFQVGAPVRPLSDPVDDSTAANGVLRVI